MNRVVDISVVVPVFNAERYLERCIQALLSQAYSKDSYEVIVVDNGSTDASLAIAEQYPQIKLLLETERGPYAARNRGISEASGTVIAFTDPDCIPSEDWLQNIVAAMVEPTVWVVLGRRCLPPLSLALSMLEAYENAKDEYVLHSQIETLYYGYTNNMAVRKELLNELGPFLNRSRGADTIFVRRVVDTYSSGIVRYCPNAVVTHLELSSIAVYYRKVFLYGYHRCLNNEIIYAEPLSTRQRLEIFRRAIRNRGFSICEAVELLCLLAGGAIMWCLGTWSELGLQFVRNRLLLTVQREYNSALHRTRKQRAAER